MPPTLAELEQQWAASFAAVTLAQDHLNLLIRQHASLGEKIARAKGPVAASQPRQPSGTEKPEPPTAYAQTGPHSGEEPPSLEQLDLDL